MARAHRKVMVVQFAQKLLGSEVIPMKLRNLRTSRVGSQHSFEPGVGERGTHRSPSESRLSAGSPPAVQRHAESGPTVHSPLQPPEL